jgi:hypothetical protein
VDVDYEDDNREPGFKRELQRLDDEAAKYANSRMREGRAVDWNWYV